VRASPVQDVSCSSLQSLYPLPLLVFSWADVWVPVTGLSSHLPYLSLRCHTPLYSRINELHREHWVWYYLDVARKEVEGNKSYWLGYIRGFADAEGSVGLTVKEIIISNTVKELLEYCQEGLNELGIYCRLLGPYKHTSIKNAKPIYRLRIQRRTDIRKWAAIIGFKDPLKAAELAELIAQLSGKPRMTTDERITWLDSLGTKTPNKRRIQRKI